MKLKDIETIIHKTPKIIIVLVAVKNITINFLGNKCCYPKGTEFKLHPDDHYLNSTVSNINGGFSWGTQSKIFSKLKFKEYRIIK
jgi:hypothetical protein